MAIVHANRNVIPPNRAHSARAPGPEILTASRGDPATKNREFILNLEPRIGQNRLKFLLQQKAELHLLLAGYYDKSYSQSLPYLSLFC